MGELTAFRAKLLDCQKHIKGSSDAIDGDGLIATTDKVLSGNMPGVWNVSDAAPEAAQAVPGSQAGVIQAGTLSKMDGRQVQAAVLEPMQSWLKRYDTAKVHMAELNKAGTRLDAARRQFYLKSQKHLKEHVAKKDNTAAPPPREDSDATLSGARTIFNTTEANMAAELAQLCSNASGLQAWLSQAMSLQAGTLSKAAAACSAGTTTPATTPAAAANAGFASAPPYPQQMPPSPTQGMPPVPHHDFEAQVAQGIVAR